MTHTEKLKLEEKMNELPKTITKNNLMDWFLDNEDKLFRRITVKELIQVAQGKGIYVKNAHKYEALTMEKVNMIKQLYTTNKKSINEISKELNMTKKEVYSQLREAKTSIRHEDIQTYYNTFSKKEIESLYRTYKLEEVLEKLNMGTRAFYMLLDKFEIKRIGKGNGRCKIA